MGNYFCEASNRAGSARKLFELSGVEFPSFLFTLSNISIVDKDTKVVDCFALGFPTPDIFWTFEGKFIQDGPEIRFNSESKSGVYSCVAENSEGKNETSLHLEVTAKLTMIDGFNDSQANKTAEEGKNLQLLCPFKNYQTLSWKHNNIDLDEKSEKLLLYVTDTSEGQYECTVSNSHDAASFVYNLDVETFPRIATKSDGDDDETFEQFVVDEVNVELGHPLKLNCRAKGNPTPNITWTKLGKIFSQNETLIIDETKNNDDGTYLCSARNSRGNAMKSVKVKAYSKPHIEANKKIVNIEGVEQQTVLLNCSIGGTPQPKFMWFKNG